MVLPTRPNELPKIKSSRHREAKLELQPGCDRDLGDPGSDLAGCERGQRREVGISFNLPEASKDRASPACCKYVPSPKVIV